jgi:hydrogenase maturation protease
LSDLNGRTVVLALGNPLRGDDGVGAAVLQKLQQNTLPPAVELVDGGTSGLEIILLVQGCKRAIIIDAADMDCEPGCWKRFTPEQVQLEARDMHLRGTMHYAGLAEALSLGAALDILPPEILILGVQPESLDWQPGLSPAVQNAASQVTQAVMALLESASVASS